ncbi:FK506-binding protein 5-like [Helianthus annuus]|uniref:FK506-binding protein 5-like n=1 Tax=Helianthus annuus TaxID=4232 RepID=UPI000B905C0C|nr:FK506-binding protein 5-like [Helianthus annuus]
MDDVVNENKLLAAESKKVADREKILEMRVRVAELEEEKTCRDEQNKYFVLKNKELEAAKALKEHEFYMLNKVVENMLGKPIEQRFEEIEVEEVRAKRQAEIEALMKDKGKNAEGCVAVAERSIVPSLVVENPVPISSVSVIFEEDVSLEDLAGDDDEEDDEDDDEGSDDEEDDDDEKVFSASSHGSDDDNDDDDNQGGMGIKVTEQSSERTVDDYLNDSVNEETEGVDGKGEHGDNQNVEQVEKLILRVEPHLEEGEHKHTYTLDDIKEMTRMVDPDFKFDIEDELNAFDINHQPEYEYKYVEDADVYDRVEVEDCTDDESVNEDTSQFPTLMEFFTEENRDELRRKVAEILKDKNFDGTPKDMQKEERQKWFKDSHERKFKRSLKYYQRDRSISLSDIISWGFLPHVNAYAIRREFGVQYFERLYDVMSLPWWDVEELSKKPHYPKRVQRVDPVTGVEETILNVKKPKAMKNIPVPKMEQDFYKGFLGWVYSCISTEAVITYRAGREIREIYVYDPMWLVNCSAKDMEFLFINKIHFQSEDHEQAMQFQQVVSICFQKGINSDSKWNSKWWSLEEKEKKKAERERKKLEANRGKRMNIQTEEEKKRKKDNDRLRNLLKTRRPRLKTMSKAYVLVLIMFV